MNIVYPTEGLKTKIPWYIKVLLAFQPSTTSYEWDCWDERKVKLIATKTLFGKTYIVDEAEDV